MKSAHLLGFRVQAHNYKTSPFSTSKSSLWYMGYVPRGGAFERPRIYCTRIIVTRPTNDASWPAVCATQLAVIVGLCACEW